MEGENWVEQFAKPENHPPGDGLLASVWQDEEPTQKGNEPSKKPPVQAEIEKADQKIVDRWQRMEPEKYTGADSVGAYIKAFNAAIKLRKSQIHTELLQGEKRNVDELFPEEEQLAKDLYLLQLCDPIPLSDELKRVSFISKLTGQLPSPIDWDDEENNAFILELRRQKGRWLDSSELNKLNWAICNNLKPLFSLPGKDGTKELYENDDYPDIADKLVMTVADVRALHQRYIDACRFNPAKPGGPEGRDWQHEISRNNKRMSNLWQRIKADLSNTDQIKEYIKLTDTAISLRKEGIKSGQVRLLGEAKLAAEEEQLAKKRFPNAIRAQNLFFLDRNLPVRFDHALRNAVNASSLAEDACEKEKGWILRIRLLFNICAGRLVLK